jgi:hypothetical protein
MIMQDYNHLWSIGKELPERGISPAVKTASILLRLPWKISYKICTYETSLLMIKCDNNE